jgi:hypothetical protein
MNSPRRILGTFDIKASTSPVGAKPDELMIDWTNLPVSTKASIYLPSVRANEIIATADGMYGFRFFTLIDAHTLGCKAQGVTFMPIPRGEGNLGGLIDVELPNTVRKGDKFTVAVSQITTAQGIPSDRKTLGTEAAFTRRKRFTPINWRKVAGTFQLAATIKTKAETLPNAERNLSLLSWIFAAIPLTDRWHPVFVRYLGALADQVSVLGGDPTTIPPSATGTWPGGPGDQGKPRRCHLPASDPWYEAPGLVGKIEGLIYDHFGDFEGFVLETENGKVFRFFSREGHMEDVVQRAWADRLRVTVTPEDNNEQCARRIVLHPTRHPL